MVVAKIRVLVVDDSKMSHAMLGRMLEDSDFQICGYAKTATEAVKLYKELRPDIVTMDMNLPDYDGIRCSQMILAIHSQVKIVMISAMRDAKLMEKGREIGICSFLGKPVTKEELVHTLNGVLNSQKDRLKRYQEIYIKPFISTLQRNLCNMAGLKSDIVTTVSESNRIIVKGMAVILGLNGHPMGRLVLYVEHQVMFKLAGKILQQDESTISEAEASECIEELANIIAGSSVSVINDVLKEREIRITPPGTIIGNDMNIVNPKLVSFNIIAKTEIGEVKMNLGFAGGE